MSPMPQPIRDTGQEKMWYLHSVQRRKAQEYAARFGLIAFHGLRVGGLLASVVIFGLIVLHLIRYALQ